MTGINYKELFVSGLHRNEPIYAGELLLRDPRNGRPGQVQWDANPDRPEFLIDVTDPRYVACLALAKQLKQKYPLDTAGLSHAELVRREAAIVKELVDEIHKHFGDYNPAILRGADSATHPTMHRDVARQTTDNPTSLREFQRDQLICRHYAPLISMLATEAGLENLYVHGDMNGFKVQGSRIVVNNNASGENSTGHAFVVSRRTLNVIEATSDKGEFAYKRRLNAVTLEELLAGKTIVTASNEQHFTAYGTQLTSGLTSTYDTRLRHFQTNASGVPMVHDAYAGVSDPAAFKAAVKQLRGQVLAYDTTLVTQQYTTHVQPMLAQFNAAIKSGDVATIREIAARFPISDGGLRAALIQAVGPRIEEAAKRGDVAKLKEIVAQGPVSKGQMADVLNNAVEQQNWAMAEFALDNGALEGYSASVKRVDIPFNLKSLDGGKTIPLNADFTQRLIAKLGLKPEEYFARAVQSRWPEHVRVAIEEIKKLPKTPDIKKMLVDAVALLKAPDARGHVFPETAKLIEDFIAAEYQNIQVGTQPVVRIEPPSSDWWKTFKNLFSGLGDKKDYIVPALAGAVPLVWGAFSGGLGIGTLLMSVAAAGAALLGMQALSGKGFFASGQGAQPAAGVRRTSYTPEADPQVQQGFEQLIAQTHTLPFLVASTPLRSEDVATVELPWVPFANPGNVSRQS